MKTITLLVAVISVCGLCADELKLADFAQHIPKGGMTVEEDSDGMKFTLSGRGARIGGDGYLSVDIPLFEYGVVEFDIMIDERRENRAMSLYLSVYNIHVFWHDACRDWRVYRPAPESQRERDFNDEPVAHQQMAKFSAGVWHHCKIVFDQQESRVEFFLDNSADPVYILGDWPVWGAAEFQGGVIRIGGMGKSRQSVIHIRGLKLEGQEKDQSDVVRDETILFNGLFCDYYNVRKFLRPNNVRCYTLENTRSSYTARNCFRYTNLPGKKTLSSARRIIFADAPVGPGELIPNFVLADIVVAVRDGAELIILDGPMALTKGGYGHSPLAEVLPDGALDQSGFSPSPKGCVILEGKAGRGSVRVVRGLRFGGSPEDFNAEGGEWHKVAESLF